jgi:transposase-like protein
MRIVEREQQILRIKNASFQSELNEQLEKHLRQQVVTTVQTIIEAALIEEVNADRDQLVPKPRRSGYFQRTLDTQYGRVDRLTVPKLRCSNKVRSWRILNRYERSLRGLLDFAGYLYIMGLSIRDLQEALHFLLGAVLSRTAINQVTLKAQEQMHAQQQAPISQTPSILIVDGVWVEIQYTLGEFKQDRAGHQRQRRQAQERVILVALAVWPDGQYHVHVLHYEVAPTESEQAWLTFLDHLIARGLDPQAVQLLVSDGSKGLTTAMKQRLPQAQQQRCITHKVRGMKTYLTYTQLPTTNDEGQVLSPSEAKQQRWRMIKQEAYDIFDAPDRPEAQQRLAAFTLKWEPLEPQAVHAFRWGIDRTFTFYSFDKELFVHIRTTNHLERLFREFRNKADEIGAFPNEISCLTLFFLVMLRDHAKHDRLQVAKTLRH